MIEWTSATLSLGSILANCVQSFRQWKSSVHLCTSSSFPHLTGLRTTPTTTVVPWSSLCPLVGSPASTMHYSIALKNFSEGSLEVQKARVPLPSPWGVVTLSGVSLWPALGTASGHRVGELPLGPLLSLSPSSSNLPRPYQVAVVGKKCMHVIFKPKLLLFGVMNLHPLPACMQLAISSNKTAAHFCLALSGISRLMFTIRPICMCQCPKFDISLLSILGQVLGRCWAFNLFESFEAQSLTFHSFQPKVGY